MGWLYIGIWAVVRSCFRLPPAANRLVLTGFRFRRQEWHSHKNRRSFPAVTGRLMRPTPRCMGLRIMCVLRARLKEFRAALVRDFQRSRALMQARYHRLPNAAAWRRLLSSVCMGNSPYA